MLTNQNDLGQQSQLWSGLPEVLCCIKVIYPLIAGWWDTTEWPGDGSSGLGSEDEGSWELGTPAPSFIILAAGGSGHIIWISALEPSESEWNLNGIWMAWKESEWNLNGLGSATYCFMTSDKAVSLWTSAFIKSYEMKTIIPSLVDSCEDQTGRV